MKLENNRNHGFSYYFSWKKNLEPYPTNESGFVPCTCGSGSGRPKNIQNRFRIRNTAFTCFCLVWSLALIYSCHVCHSPCIIIIHVLSVSLALYLLYSYVISVSPLVVVNPVLVLLLALLVFLFCPSECTVQISGSCGSGSSTWSQCESGSRLFHHNTKVGFL